MVNSVLCVKFARFEILRRVGGTMLLSFFDDITCICFFNYTGDDEEVIPMCQQATLKAVIGMIPAVYKGHPESALALLFMLVTSENTKPPMVTDFHDSVSLLLFEEDKPRSYFERVAFLEFVLLAVEEIMPLISIYSPLLEDIALNIKVHTTDLVHKLGYGAGGIMINPWNDPEQFYTHLRVLQVLVLLRNRCDLASEQEMSAVVCATVSSCEKELQLLPSLVKKSLHPLYEKQLSIILGQ